MTVRGMEATMSNAEWVKWRMFVARRAQRRELADKVAANKAKVKR